MNMPSPDILEVLTPVVAELKRLGVRYYVCGSVASTFYGTYRSTADVDLVAELAPSHVAPFAKAIRGDFYVDERMILDAIARKSCFNVIHAATCFKVDIFAVKGRAYDRQLLDRIREDSLFDEDSSLRVSIASPEDVILAKLEWYRLGDEISDHQWSDVVEVIKVNRRSLDRKYLEHWAGEIGVADLLARAWNEAETDGS